MAVFTWIGWLWCFVSLLGLTVWFFVGFIATVMDWTRCRSAWPWVLISALFSAGMLWLWSLMFTCAPWGG